jgi:hypothetical protein
MSLPSPSGRALAVIGPREASIFTCLTDALVAPACTRKGEPPLPPVRETDALLTFDIWLAHSPPLNRLGLRAALHLLEISPLLSRAHTRLRRLHPDARRAWLARLERIPLAPLHDLLLALKSLLLLAYYGDPALMARVGYDAPANLRRGRELRRVEGRP